MTRPLSWRLGSLALRTFLRYLAINGTERAVVLAGQAFSALIPLLIVLSTLYSGGNGPKIADTITTRFALSGNAAEAVRTLFAQPPGAAQSITVGSLLLLIISSLSLARTLQRTYETAWQLPSRGLRGAFGGFGALALLLTQIVLVSLFTGFLRSIPAASLTGLILRAAASSAIWLALQRLLLGGRVGWARLLPGAVAAGTGQQVVAQLSTLWIPHAIQNNATQYGTIGVSFALLSWLVLISVVLVVAAALSVELGGGPPLPAGAGRAGPVRGFAGLLGADEALPVEASDSTQRRSPPTPPSAER